MNEKLRAFWEGKSKEDVEKAVNRSMTTLMVVDFICAIGIYAALKIWASPFLAECWLIAIYAYCLKSNVDLTAPRCQAEMMKKLQHSQGDNANEGESKDIGEDKPKA